MPLIETIVALYAFTAEDMAALEAELFEQMRLAYLEHLRSLATQHGIPNAAVMLGPSEEARLRAKAREDASSIANTYNQELRAQVEAIFARNPAATREDVIDILASWGRNRAEYKAIQVAIYSILWSANLGFDLFITRNNLQQQLFRAVGGIPVCPECQRIVAYGIVPFAVTQEYPLPLHLNCTHEWTVVNATDLGADGSLVWLGV